MTAPSGDDALPIALTMGEPAGVGGEIALKAWLNRSHETPVFFLIDDVDRLGDLARRLQIEVPVHAIETPAEARDAFARGLPVIPQPLAAPVRPGRLDALNAPAVTAAIERAVAFAQAGSAGGVVTNPIHKANLMEAGFPHPGHTEFLAALAGDGVEPVMMLACETLRVVPVTRHLGLRDALDQLSPELIQHAALVTADTLKRDFGVAAPRIAVAGLNPHAGEGGHMGSEEGLLIEPALARLRDQGLDVVGPLPADTLFHAQARARYDAALCMYHDQALIPIKTLAFDRAVNVTLGIPFIRTSPDHGTALDIAGTGKAHEGSLVAAIRMAAAMAARRRKARAAA